MSKVIRIAAALIDDGCGRVFLVRKRGTAAFMQAGGKIDRDETPFDALMRELLEELEFSPAPDEAKFLGTYSCLAANEPGHLLEAHLFHVRVVYREFTPAAELDEVVWVSVDAAQQMELAPFTREFVLPLLERLRC